MNDTNTGGPAFPANHFDMADGEHGMTLRQYAAIHLRVPNSGTDWLDEMIRTSLRDDVAAKAMPACIQFCERERWDWAAKRSYQMADAMLKARDAK